MENTVLHPAAKLAEKRLNQHPSIRMNNALKIILEIASVTPASEEDKTGKLLKLRKEASSGLKEETENHLISWATEVENSIRSIENELDNDPSIPRMKAALETILSTLDNPPVEEPGWNVFQDINETARLGLPS